MIHHVRAPWQLDIAGIAFCVGVSALAYSLVLGPQMRRAEALAQQRTDLRVWTQQLSQLSGLAADLDSRLESTRRRLAESPLVLDPASALNERLNDLNTIANNHRLDVHALNVRPEVTMDDKVTFPIEFAGSGSFGDLIEFLDTIHEELPTAGIVAFRIMGGDSGTSDTSFVLDLAWYAGAEDSDQIVQGE